MCTIWKDSATWPCAARDAQRPAILFHLRITGDEHPDACAIDRFEIGDVYDEVAAAIRNQPSAATLDAEECIFQFNTTGNAKHGDIGLNDSSARFSDHDTGRTDNIVAGSRGISGMQAPQPHPYIQESRHQHV